MVILRRFYLILLLPMLVLGPRPSWAQHQHPQPGHGHTPQTAAAPAAEQKGPMGMPASGPIHITMEALHASGGVPPGWRFTLPPGDAAAGREVFIAMKCYTCHDVAGEKFPAHRRDVGEVGPGLTGMGGHHPAEYFAESILNPNAVILEGAGFTGPDRLSVMPEYLDSMSLRQLVDLVAYLRSLTPGHAQAAEHEKPKFYEGEGEVRIVNLEDKTLVVKHGEIKGFMGAMTMGYPVDPPELMKGLKKGDKIRFKIDAAKEVIVEITKVE